MFRTNLLVYITSLGTRIVCIELSQDYTKWPRRDCGNNGRGEFLLSAGRCEPPGELFYSSRRDPGPPTRGGSRWLSRDFLDC